MAEGDRPDSEGFACPDCGADLDLADVFCSSCGTKVRITDPEETARRDESGGDDDQYGESRREFRRRVRTKLAEGWEIEHDGEDSVVLIDRSFGNPWAHVALALFTGGVGNVIYAWYKYESDVDRRIMRRGDTTAGEGTAPGPTTFDDEDDDPPVKATLAGLGLVLLGVYLLATYPLAVGSVLWALFLLIGGAYVMPQVRNRLADRHPVTTFGRTKSTDETLVEAPDVPCTVCLSPIESGVRRTYTEQQVFAGVPLFTTESGENHYCQSCAVTGVSTSSVTDAASPELEALLEDQAESVADESDSVADESGSKAAEVAQEVDEVVPEDDEVEPKDDEVEPEDAEVAPEDDETESDDHSEPDGHAELDDHSEPAADEEESTADAGGSAGEQSDRETETESA